MVVLSSPTNECYVSITFTAASHTATFNSPQRVIQRNRMRGAKGDLDREEEPETGDIRRFLYYKPARPATSLGCLEMLPQAVRGSVSVPVSPWNPPFIPQKS